MKPNAERWLAVAGVLGGVLYLSGDFLFYGELTSGSFHPLSVMSRRDDATLIAGAVVAPLASLGYILGTIAVALSLRPRRGWLAWTFLASWTGMFLVGIAYHAVYATRGFAAKLSEPAAVDITLERVGALLSTLYAGEAALGAIGTVLLAAGVLLKGSGYPRWLLVLTPTAWALANMVPRSVPAPIGSLLAGGWINGWFTIFFAAALVARSRASSRAVDGRAA